MAYVILHCISRHALRTLFNVNVLIYLLDFYLKIFNSVFFNCLALQHFRFKRVIEEAFSLQFFSFICSMKERKNAFNSENEVITVSCFLSRTIVMIIYNASPNLWTWKLRGVYYLIHYLKDGFVRKMNHAMTVLTSMVFYFSSCCFCWIFNRICLFCFALFSEFSWYSQKKKRQEGLPHTH